MTETWIDAPTLAGQSADPPDDLDRALDSLANAITVADATRREEGAGANPLARTSAFDRTGKVLAKLPARRMIAFLQRYASRNAEGAAALVPPIADAGAADIAAKTQLFLNMTNPARLAALLRALEIVGRSERTGAGS